MNSAKDEHGTVQDNLARFIQHQNESSSSISNSTPNPPYNQFQQNNQQIKQEEREKQSQSQQRSTKSNQKQVRFDIKDGLKHMIKESNIDIQNITSQSTSTVNLSYSKSKSQSQLMQKSPQVSIQNQNKKYKKKVNKLAFVYKQEALESKKRKGLVQENDMLQSNRSDKDYKQYQTPNFNQYTNSTSSKRDYQQMSPNNLEELMLPPQPPQPPKPQEKPCILGGREKVNNDQEQFNQQQVSTQSRENSRVIGTIIKNNNSNSRTTTEVSLNYGQAIGKIGSIVRQRSTSPQVSILGLNKENISMIANSTKKPGQIFRSSNNMNISKLNQTFSSVDQVNILSPQQKQMIHTDKILIQSQKKILFQESQIEQQKMYFWNLLQLPIQDIRELESKEEYILQLNFNLQKCLSNYKIIEDSLVQGRLEQIPTSYISQLIDQQHRIIRKNLQYTQFDKYKEDIIEIVELKNRLEGKKRELRESIKQIGSEDNKQQQFNPQLFLKIEILKDICSRLKQKIILKVLKFHSLIKKQRKEEFYYYHNEFIQQPLQKVSFVAIKQYFLKRKEKQVCVDYGKQELTKIKLQQVFESWKFIKQTVNLYQEKFQEARSILQSRKCIRLLTQWKVYIIKKRNKELSQQLLKEKIKQKYLYFLFVKWVVAIQQQSKIKRKAIQLVSNPKKQLQLEDEQYNTSNNKRGSIEWMREVKLKTEENFFKNITEVLLERSHNRDFIDSLLFKIKPKELEQQVPLSQFIEERRNSLGNNTSAYQVNEVKIYKNYPFLKNNSPLKSSRKQESDNYNALDYSPTQAGVMMRKSMDADSLNLKYQIHYALVNQQNTNTQLMKSKSFIMQNDEQTVMTSVIQENTGTQRFQNLIPPRPQRIIEQQMNQIKQQQVSYTCSPPNQIYEKIEKQLQMKEKKQLFIEQYQDKQSELPLKLQIQEHIKQLKFNCYLLDHQQTGFHYSQSLKVNASKDVEQEEIDQYQTYNVTDYIEYGMASSQPRITFINLFQNRVISKLFTQWKIKFIKKWINHDLSQLHTLSHSKICIRNWKDYKYHNIQRAITYNQTKQMQKFYRVFNKWQQMTREQFCKDIKILKLQRQKVVFRAWIKYLEKQGDYLARILRSQQYYQQALTSKALLAMYQYYLKEMRIKKFSKLKVFKKFFKKIWQQKYLQRNKLRTILQFIEEKANNLERNKFQREYQVKKELFEMWISKVKKQYQEGKKNVAKAHYQQNLSLKYFKQWKQYIGLSKIVKNIQIIQTKLLVIPAFIKIKKHVTILKNTQSNWTNYRQSYLKQAVLYKWREISMKKRLTQMMIKKRYYNYLKNYVYYVRSIKPRLFRIQKLKSYFLKEMKEVIREKWREERSVIIVNELERKRVEKVMKIVFLKFLENILIQKRKRIIESTITDFKFHNLREKAYNRWKLFWSKKKRNHILNAVANDFHRKIVKRRELRIKHFYEMNGIRYKNEEDHLRSRVFTQWRIRTQDKVRKMTVLSRFMNYKSRLLTLRCLLSWRQTAKYEQTYRSSYYSTSQQQSFVNYPLQTYYTTSQNQNSTKQLTKKDPLILSSRDLAVGTGLQDITQVLPIQSETPIKGDDFLNTPNKQGPDNTLFNELEQIFSKNNKWLEEQREREQFLREMAAHYNQTLSHEMSTLKYSTERLQTISAAQSKHN